MNIEEALKIIGEKFETLKPATEKAATDNKELATIIQMLIDQYEETKGNKKRLNRILGEKVFECLYSKAKEINYWAEIKLMEMQAKENED